MASEQTPEQRACWHLEGHWFNRYDPNVGVDKMYWECNQCGAIFSAQERANMDDGLTADGNTAHG